MTRKDKFLQQYPNASVEKTHNGDYICVLPCYVDTTLQGDMSRRECAESKGYADHCKECLIKYWNQEVD